MSERIIYDETNEPIGHTPVVEHEVFGEVFLLDWENTCIRKFGENFETLNHLEHRTSNGRLIGILFKNLQEEFIEELEELQFPQKFEPIPPIEDRKWYDRIFLEPYRIQPPHELTTPTTSPQSSPTLGALIVTSAFNILFGDPKKPLL